MSHVGGQLQAQFMARVRGRDLERCLVVPVDVGKSSAVAVGHRAHRLAFAMLRDQQPYDPARWAESVAASMTAMAKTRRARQNDVTCPPPATSVPEGGDADNSENARRARG